MDEVEFLVKMGCMEFLINGLRTMAESGTMTLEDLQAAVMNFCKLAEGQMEGIQDGFYKKKTVKAA